MEQGETLTVSVSLKHMIGYVEVLHRTEVCPSGALLPDGEAGAAVQDGVRGGGRGGADHQLRHRPRQADQDQVQ